ncbi:acyltransferase [Flagellimonas alvinocaridis]|uniref:Acyltransferase n=2 Tax=Flagellimonas alvinocaridis TaxID=2530200 RepID=A0A4S8RKC3_9FLAO|nr:acyltransferase [Allomuricauda alvinocaridis]
MVQGLLQNLTSSVMKFKLFRQNAIDLLRRKSSQRFIPEIDALRFFAILPVMFAHCSQAFLEYNTNFDRELIESESLLRYVMYQGNLGVELFFGISGFILALPFLGKKIKELDFRSYFLRRLIRIEPPYLIAISVFFLVHLFIMGQHDFAFLWDRYVASFFYVHNLAYHSYSYILPPAWSLEIEVQFYLLMPIFILGFCLMNKAVWRYFLYFLMLMLSLHLDVTPDLDLNDYLRYFLAGIIAADVYKNVKFERFWVWDIFFVVNLFLFFFVFGDWMLRTLSLFLILISSFNLSILKKVVTNNWVTVIGGMCYSLYLLHFPFYHLVMKIFSDRLTFIDSYEFTFISQALIFVPLSIVVITGYYLLVEKPFMVLSQKYGKIGKKNTKKLKEA